MPRIFNDVKNANPGKSVFDLSYSKLFTCDMGQLIPVVCDEMVPGDTFDMGAEIIVRFQPLVAPILHQSMCMCIPFSSHTDCCGTNGKILSREVYRAI